MADTCYWKAGITGLKAKEAVDWAIANEKEGDAVYVRDFGDEGELVFASNGRSPAEDFLRDLHARFGVKIAASYEMMGESGEFHVPPRADVKNVLLDVVKDGLRFLDSDVTNKENQDAFRRILNRAIAKTK